MSLTRPSARLLPALLVLFAACAGAPPAQWQEGQIEVGSENVLFEVTRLALEREGFPVLVRAFEPSTRSLKSGWRTDLHPFKGEGFRERAEISFEWGEPGTAELSVRVEREINQNVARPLDPAVADWEKAPDNPARARRILQYVRSMLHQAEPAGGGR